MMLTIIYSLIVSYFLPRNNLLSNINCMSYFEGLPLDILLGILLGAIVSYGAYKLRKERNQKS
jgi:uncharacterized membrane protein